MREHPSGPKPSLVVQRLARPRDEKLVRELALVWESSVLSTHHFLDKADFLDIRVRLPELLRNVDTLYACFVDNEAKGFRP